MKKEKMCENCDYLDVVKMVCTNTEKPVNADSTCVNWKQWKRQ